MDFAVYGIPAAAIIVVLLQVCKHYGLASRWAVLVAIGLGVAFSVAVYLASISVEFAVWFKVAMAGLMTGLAAAGFYSGQKAVRGQ